MRRKHRSYFERQMQAIEDAALAKSIEYGMKAIKPMLIVTAVFGVIMLIVLAILVFLWTRL